MTEGHNGHRSHEPPAPQPLHRAEDDEPHHPGGEPAERGAEEEEDDGALQDDLPAVQVAELPVERSDDRLREEVGGDDPGEVLQPAELGDDGGQRGGHDGRVQSGEQEHHDQPGEDRSQVHGGRR